MSAQLETDSTFIDVKNTPQEPLNPEDGFVRVYCQNNKLKMKDSMGEITILS